MVSSLSMGLRAALNCTHDYDEHPVTSSGAEVADQPGRAPDDGAAGSRLRLSVKRVDAVAGAGHDGDRTRGHDGADRHDADGVLHRRRPVCAVHAALG